MGVPIFEGVISEGKAAPYTMIAVVFLLLAVPYIWEHAAWAEDLRSVQAQLSQLSYDSQRGNLEQQLRSVSTDIFNLRQKVKDKEVAHQPVDPLNYDRINALEIEKSSLERRLAALRPL